MTERYRSQNDSIKSVGVGRPIAGGRSNTREYQRLYQRLLPIGLLLWAVGLWLVSLPFVKPREMTDIGLLSVLPFFYYAGLIILSASFCYVLFRQPRRGWLLTLHVVAFILMIHATPTLLYGTLRYSWSWKHVGVVDYIIRHGSVNPSIDFLTAYHNWPGFFAVNAFIVDAAGLDSTLAYAPAATLFFNLMYLGGLVLILRSLTTDPRLIWLAVWFFFITNWVGQDYFAPQSFAYFFYLVAIGIVLRWFAVLRPAAAPESGAVTAQMPIRAGRSGVLKRGWGALRQRLERLVPGPALTPAQRVVFISIVILMLAVITFSHQLTPIILLFMLLALVAFRLVYPRSLPVLLGVMVLAWIFLMTGRFSVDIMQTMVESFGAVGENIASNLIDLRTASTGQIIVSFMGRGLTVLIVFLAAMGFVRRMVSGHFDLAAVLLIAVPFTMLLINSYGGEILFRIYFFTLPFLAFFAAALFVPDPKDGRHWLYPIGATLLSAGIIVSFLFAYYGKEKQYYMTPGEIEAATYLYDHALPGSLIIEGTRNYPTLFRNYERFIYVPIDREMPERIQTMVQQPVEEMERWMENRQYPGAYLLITRSMKADVEMIGDLPAGSLDEIEQKLIASGKFNLMFENEDAKIFVLKDRRRE